MKALILYHPNSEFARSVEEYAHDFNRQRGLNLELLSVDTREGAAVATLYDIMTYPAVLAIKDDGELIKEWQGAQLPLMNEVSGYLRI